MLSAVNWVGSARPWQNSSPGSPKALYATRDEGLFSTIAISSSIVIGLQHLQGPRSMLDSGVGMHLRFARESLANHSQITHESFAIHSQITRGSLPVHSRFTRGSLAVYVRLTPESCSGSDLTSISLNSSHNPSPAVSFRVVGSPFPSPWVFVQ